MIEIVENPSFITTIKSNSYSISSIMVIVIWLSILMFYMLISLSISMLFRDIARGKERMPIPVTNDADNTNYPTDFVYVTESVWTSPVPINTTISSLSVSKFISMWSRNCGYVWGSELQRWFKK